MPASHALTCPCKSLLSFFSPLNKIVERPISMKMTHHQPYRTQSDTLKLQRLIEVLKERGSDLGSSLESSASDFLTDVKPRAAARARRFIMVEDASVERIYMISVMTTK